MTFILNLNFSSPCKLNPIFSLSRLLQQTHLLCSFSLTYFKTISPFLLLRFNKKMNEVEELIKTYITFTIQVLFNFRIS